MSDRPPHIVIAIDGPAASGKSSVARVLARQLGIAYVNTGAMYRAVTWHALRSGVALNRYRPRSSRYRAARSSPAASTNRASRRFSSTVSTRRPSSSVKDQRQRLADRLIAEVRRVLVELQRTYAEYLDVVMEGRDIGSAVFPDTRFKFYIDASAEVRAQRRARQGLQDSILKRDKLDSSRRASPLIIAEDAHVIDSSSLTIDGVAGEIVGRLKQKGLGIAPTRSALLGVSAEA